MTKKRCFHGDHKKRPFARNADIDRVLTKKPCFHGVHKKRPFALNVDIKRVMDKIQKPYIQSVRNFGKLLSSREGFCKFLLK